MEQQEMGLFETPAELESFIARTKLNTMMERRKKHGIVPMIDDVKYIEDGNLTVVVVKSGSNEFVGWAKFNPNDVKKLRQTSKRGKTHFKIETKFNAKAGRNKALHRALEKML